MTRDKAIDLIDNLIGMVEDNSHSDYDTAFKMAIKALEQESILDKIRAEIEKQKTTMNMFNREDTKQYAIAMEDVLVRW